MTRLLSFLTLLIFACTSFVQALPYPNDIEHHKTPCITHDLVHGINGAIGGAIVNGKDGAIAGAFVAVLAERLAKTLMPTKVEVTETTTNAAGKHVHRSRKPFAQHTPLNALVRCMPLSISPLAQALSLPEWMLSK